MQIPESVRKPSQQKMFCMTWVSFSMMSSDSQAMGRVGEVITRTWQTADKMKNSADRFRKTVGKMITSG